MRKSRTIGIVGSRRRNDFDDFLKVYYKLFKLFRMGDVICSGLCPKGADNFAKFIAETHQIESIWFPADWQSHGRAAGFIRNTDIAKSSDILIACVADDRKGGTEDTITKFKKFHGSKKLYLV